MRETQDVPLKLRERQGGVPLLMLRERQGAVPLLMLKEWQGAVPLLLKLRLCH